MSYTAKQWRAINWLVKRDELKPQLSAFPMIRMLKPDGSIPMIRMLKPDGSIFEENITTIVSWHDNFMVQERRARAKRSKEAA